MWKSVCKICHWSDVVLVSRTVLITLKPPIVVPSFESREQREREMSATASYLARRAAQKERVRILYRRALKDTLNWAVHRHLFYQDVFPFFFFSFLPRFSAILIYFSRVLFHFTLFFIFWYSSSLFQASDLREKFDANKHVVRSLIRSVNCFYLFWNFVNDMKSSRNWSWANTLFLKLNGWWCMVILGSELFPSNGGLFS